MTADDSSAGLLHVILHQPEIPQNTGNVGRSCAYAGARLHLIHPLGFTITDRHLRRSGMDYWRSIDLHHHEDWTCFRQSAAGPRRVWMLSTRGELPLWRVAFRPGDGLLFGGESAGCPQDLHDEMAGRRVSIPCFGDQSLRSLNLATAVGVALFEALRQVRATAGS